MNCWIPRILAFVFINLFLVTKSINQSQLSAGDIAFTSINAQQDEFSFLALKDLTQGTVLFFTDNGWLADDFFRFGEGYLGVYITCQVNCGSELIVRNGAISNSVGTIVGEVSYFENFGLSVSGDQLIALQFYDEVEHFLAAVNFGNGGSWQDDAVDSHSSNVPFGLVEGETAIAIPFSDYGRFDCTITDGLQEDLLASIHDKQNWLEQALENNTCNYNVNGCGSGGTLCGIDNYTSLQLGDIVFTGYQSQHVDQFSFLTLKDIIAGSIISFTDNPWFSSGDFLEIGQVCSIKFIENVNCGQQVTVNERLVLDDQGQVVARISGQMLKLSQSRDQIFAFQGDLPSSTDQSGFLAGIKWGGDWISGGSALPCVFEGTDAAVSFQRDYANGILKDNPNASLHQDNIHTYFSKSENWKLSSARNLSYPPILTFTCQTPACQAASIPVISSSTQSICPGEEVTITIIDGFLGDANDWYWYSSSCDNLIGVGSSITVSPTETTTYFVRADGGCTFRNPVSEGATIEIIGDGPLPTPWLNTDIGQASGNASGNACTGSFSLTSTGFGSLNDDISHLIYQPFTGNFEIKAHVSAIEGEGLSSMYAGLQLRESLTPGSRIAGVLLKKSSNNVYRQYRVSTDGSLTLSSKRKTNQSWVRLKRTSNTIKAYTSSNGLTWSILYSLSMNLPDCIYVGMVGRTGNNSTTVTAHFDQVTIPDGESCSNPSPAPVAIYHNATSPAIHLPSEGKPYDLLRVFPNPSTSQIKVSFSDLPDIGSFELNILDLQGKSHLSKRLVGQLENSTLELDTQSLPPGVYYVQVKISRDKVLYQRFIKQ